jgi:ribonuclease I
MTLEYPPLTDDFFPIETSIHRGLTTAIFDYQRVTPVGNPFASFILALSWQSTATSKTT